MRAHRKQLWTAPFYLCVIKLHHDIDSLQKLTSQLGALTVLLKVCTHINWHVVNWQPSHVDIIVPFYAYACTTSSTAIPRTAIYSVTHIISPPKPSSISYNCEDQILPQATWAGKLKLFSLPQPLLLLPVIICPFLGDAASLSYHFCHIVTSRMDRRLCFSKHDSHTFGKH
jgi:hypothetical protein